MSDSDADLATQLAQARKITGAAATMPLTSRLSFAEPGRVVVRTGKVELGQGIHAALIKVAADELGISPDAITIPHASTAAAPDEGWTAGSFSIQTSGVQVGAACRQARALLIEEATARLGVEPRRLRAGDGRFLCEGEPTGLDYWAVAHVLEGVMLDPQVAEAGAAPDLGAGDDIARFDLTAKVGGAAFIHDLVLAGLRHARVVRPPDHGAELDGIDQAAFRRSFPDMDLVIDGTFVAVVAEREEDAVRASDRVREMCRWRSLAEAPRPGEIAEWLPGLPSRPQTLTVARAGTNDLSWHGATYSRPAIAHASIGPSCGVAHVRDGRLSVWSHSQNIFALRNAIAAALRLDPITVDVFYLPGAGCYGHNGADDAAFDAAVVAVRLGGTPVRVQWSREEELAWAPVGAPMVVHIDAGLDDSGGIGAWRLELWTPPHARRPGLGGVNLLSATMLETPTPSGPSAEVPLPMGGGNRNATAIYDFPDHQVIDNFIADFPIRTSSLRSLGAHANIFAIESMMDELAALSGQDPVAFRLRHLSDPRARRVLEAAAAMSGWSESAIATGLPRGVALGRYKDVDGGYAAIVAEVVLGDDVVASRIWCAADLGRVISPDGARNQIEGGIIQSISWALREAATLGPRGVETRSWQDYPILRFSETPEIVVELVGDAADPPLGAGEIVQGPATAAVANAVASALGARIRSLPLSRERIIAALSGSQ